MIRMGSSIRHMDKCRPHAENDQIFTKAMAQGNCRLGPKFCILSCSSLKPFGQSEPNFCGAFLGVWSVAERSKHMTLIT